MRRVFRVIQRAHFEIAFGFTFSVNTPLPNVFDLINEVEGYFFAFGFEKIGEFFREMIVQQFVEFVLCILFAFFVLFESFFLVSKFFYLNIIWYKHNMLKHKLCIVQCVNPGPRTTWVLPFCWDPERERGESRIVAHTFFLTNHRRGNDSVHNKHRTPASITSL